MCKFVYYSYSFIFRFFKEVLMKGNKANRIFSFIVLLLLPINLLLSQSEEAIKILEQNNPGVISLSIIGENKEIVKEGLVKEMTHQIAGKDVLLVLNMKGCAHLPKEARLKKDGVKPYICPITNMILDQLIEKLGYETSYLSEIEIDEKTGECRTRSAIYEDETKIGVVCDWNEELPPSL